MSSIHRTYQGLRRVRSRGAGRLAQTFVIVLAAVATAAFVALPASPAKGATAGNGTYNWPVKPFDRAHPVRANFGDPRTTFAGPPTLRGLMTSGGIFEFHFGIDISVPDGTAVYAVQSGVASLLNPRVVHVDGGSGLATEYWHIIPAVKRGQQVVAYETVLGHVMKGYEHVHFTELEHGRAVNPLAAGHLTPYADTTRPEVAAISFRESDVGAEVLPEYLHGRVLILANAFDMPTLPVPGIWANLPVAPALLSWRIERANDGRVVVPTQIAFDVRSALPPQGAFWSFYARGTRQNMATFGSQPRSWRVPGLYLYKLSRQPFDTARLQNGIYELVVTAADIRGNESSARQVFIIRNGRPV